MSLDWQFCENIYNCVFWFEIPKISQLHEIIILGVYQLNILVYVIKSLFPATIVIIPDVLVTFLITKLCLPSLDAMASCWLERFPLVCQRTLMITCYIQKPFIYICRLCNHLLLHTDWTCHLLPNSFLLSLSSMDQMQRWHPLWSRQCLHPDRTK